MPGYAYDFETEPDDNLLCGLCSLVIKDFVVTLCCDQRFCADCIFQWLGHHSSCPSCGDVLQKQSLSLGDIYTRRQIKNLRVGCRICQQRYTVHKFEAHESSCRRINAFSQESQDRQQHVTVTSRHQCCSKIEQTLLSTRFRFISLTLLSFVIIAAVIVMLVLLPSKQGKRTPVLSEQCTIGGDPCAPDDGRITVCDLTTSSCLLKVGQDCSKRRGNICVTGALCDRGVTDTCVCTPGHLTVDGICMLQPGSTCSGGLENLCEPSTYCDLTTAIPHLCQCWDYFYRQGDLCQLKVEVATANCSAVSACVDHATCDDQNTLQCQCDSNYMPKSTGLCGLSVGVNVPCDNMTSCVDYATCDVNNTNLCECDTDFSPKVDGTCGLQVGANVDCSTVTSCVDHAVCDVSGTKRCVCATNFVSMSSAACGLKAELLGVDCRAASSCVENATCDAGSTNQCLCDSGYTRNMDGTCGLVIGASTPCSNVTSCVDHAACDVTSTNQCVCITDFLDKSDGKCGLKVGSSIDCILTSACVDNAHCDLGSTKQCVCDTNYTLQPNGTCYL